MANWLSDKIRPVTHRDIAVVTQMALGVATIIAPPTPGTSYAYLQESGIQPDAIGIALFATAFMMGISRNKAVYFAACLIMLVFAAVSILGFFSGKVSFQAIVLYIGLFAHAIRAFPERAHVT